MPTVSAISGSSNRTLTPAGTHLARCVQIIDLGTQNDEWKGKPKKSRKIRLTWELPEELHVFDEKKGEQPFFISKKYTANLGEKASLRKDLESWRGKQFTEEELKGFNLDVLLGVPCMITIVHRTSDAGTVHENIASISKLPKSAQCLPQISPGVIYDIKDGENAVYASLPQFLRDMISQSDEWQHGAPEATNEPSGAEHEDEVPF